MNKPIRIGTRHSELALWQAHTVQRLLEENGHKTEIVPITSKGDIVLNKPLYALGITGVFTKSLDIALLENEIDIAVHSMKDVPTQLPIGVKEVAVLKRGNIKDILVYKNNLDFLEKEEQIIATGSLRRRAQWLHRYEKHKTVDLRGNVNLRLEKLNNNNWQGAIFAKAGLERINILPENHLDLDWMIPAPAQGAVMIVALETNNNAIHACKPLNHKETASAVKIERDFMRKLEGGCTAPIGANVSIVDSKIHFKGGLFDLDGREAILVEDTFSISENMDEIGIKMADIILKKGGKELMGKIKSEIHK